MHNDSKTLKKLNAGIIAIVILSLCLCITTFALVYATVYVENNLFATGIVNINLNDGKPVIEKYNTEPGATEVRYFFIENHSTWDVYYKIYFKNITGELANVLDVQIFEDETNTLIFSGKMTDLTRDKVGAADDILRLGEHKNFKIVFHFPEEAGNEAQNLDLTFDIAADAVQTKNNPERLFN